MRKMFLMGVIIVVALTFVLSSCTTTPPLKDDYVSGPVGNPPALPEEPTVPENGNLQPPALPEE